MVVCFLDVPFVYILHVGVRVSTAFLSDNAMKQDK